MEPNCNFCKESSLNIGDKTEYGARVIYKIGNLETGWFATLSPKTGGDPEKDFCIQLMPNNHLLFFSDIHKNLELSKNYGIAFAKLSYAIGKIISEQIPQENKIPIGIYGKCKHENEHIHFKIFPWRNKIGQPYTLDSSFEKKIVFIDENDEKFVKMKPIKKVNLSNKLLNELSNKLISFLK